MRRPLVLLGVLAAACGRGSSAHPQLRAACGAGDAAACGELSTELKARCSSSPAGGCRDLALLHAAGRLDAVDPAEVLRLFERACETGEGRACREAATFQPETPRAERLLQIGCDHGDPRSCRDLVVELRTAGREQERADALFRAAAKLYQGGCDAGRGEDCLDLGRLHTTVAPPDEAKAEAFQRKGVGLLEASCAGGDAAACFHLGMAYHDGAGVETDFARHLRQVERSCSLGHLDGCAELAAAYASSEPADDDAKAPALFEKACRGGVLHRRPCREAGFFFVDGRVVPADKAKGARLLETSCALGDEPSCWMVAGMLREGDGVEADVRRAAALAPTAPRPEIRILSVKRAKQAPDPAAYQLGIDPTDVPQVKAGAGQDLIVVTFDVRRTAGGGALPVRTVWVLDAQGRRHPSLLPSEFPLGQTEHERRDMVFPVPQGVRPVKVRFELGALTFDLPPA